MKLALFTVGYRYPGSLSETVVAGSLNGPFYLSRALTTLGVDVHVFSQKNKNDLFESSLAGVKIHRYGRSNLKSIFKFILEDYRCYLLFKKIHSKEKFDLIQTQDALLFTALFARKHKIPIVFTDHGSPVNCLEDMPSQKFFLKRITNWLYNQPLYNFIIKRAKKVVLISKELYKNSEKELGISVPEEKLVLIPNGVDTCFFAPQNVKSQRSAFKYNKNIILFVGRISHEKGIHLMLRVLPDVVKKYPETMFLIVGAPVSQHKNYLEYLKQMSLKNKTDDHVKFCLNVPEEELAKYYSLGDILIVPSIGYDPMPNVLFEGQASGLPIISTDFKPRHEIITRDTGYLFKENDLTGLKESIFECFKNKEKLKAMGIRSRKNMIENYDVLLSAKKYIDIYKQVIIHNK